MIIGKKDKFKNKLNNEGYSLIEVIVVIAIMAIMTGLVSLGISYAFSKDAARCAASINDALTEVRMLSMTKEGDFSITISVDSDGHHIATIVGGTTSVDAGGENHYNETYKQVIDLEGNSGIRIESIVCNTPNIRLSSNPTESGNKVEIAFDKTKGNVHSVNGTVIDTDSIMVFDIIPTRGSRQAKVQLVTSTGKHTVGEF